MKKIKYITKNEYKEKSEICRKLILDVQKYIKNNYGINFNFKLIGSARYRLIVKNGDHPIDFDYQIIITKCKEEFKPSKVREIFFKIFDKNSRKYGFDKLNNDTKTIKIKHHSNNDHIDFCIEVAIFKKLNNQILYLHFDKSINQCIWNKEDDVLDWFNRFYSIRKKYWVEFKELYLEKRKKDFNKKSFGVFKETIKEMEDKIE